MAGKISADDARSAYLRLYSNGLRGLGYEVLNREIRRHGRTGPIMYFMIFASGSKAGLNIMRWCFEQVFPREVERLEPFLPGFEPPATRDV